MKEKLKNFDWGNFFYYYKFHLIFGVFAIILLSSLIYTIVTKESVDLSVHIIGNSTTDELSAEPLLTKKLSSVLKSVDGDDEFKVDAIVKTLSPYHLSNDDQTGAMKIIEWNKKPTDADYMMVEKITLDLTTGEPSLYIIDGDIMRVYMSQGVFEPLEALDIKKETGELMGESELEPGVIHTYGLSLEGNKFVQSLGIDTTNKFIAVRTINHSQKNNDKMKIYFDNAIQALIHIVED